MKENWKLKEIIKDKDRMIKFYQNQEKQGSRTKEPGVIRKDDAKSDVNSTNDELAYFLCDTLNKLPESKSYRVMYKYLTDGMKYLLKTETCIILKKDFSENKYKGFICDLHSKENFKPVETSLKEKFIASLNEGSGPIVYSEKDKEEITPFLVKYFETTAYNCLAVPVNAPEVDNLGWIMFLNKNILKERFDFNTKDLTLALV